MVGPLEKKSMAFAIRIVKMAQFLTTNKNEYVLSKQVLKSGTSIGANIREAQGGQSTVDFISKLSISLKEAFETDYWLELLYATEYIQKSNYVSMHKDLHELISMLTRSIKTSKTKIKPSSNKQSPNS